MTASLDAALDRRSRVLRAALVVAAESEPGQMRVADIAELAGMSPGHVMYYFERRDRILSETLLYAENELVRRRNRLVAAAAGDPVRAVAGLVRLYLPRGSGDPRWRLWAQLLASPPADDATIAAYTLVVDSWSDALAAILRRGGAAGCFTTRDPERTAYRACRLMDGLALEVLLGNSRRTRAWAVTETLDALGDWLDTTW